MTQPPGQIAHVTAAEISRNFGQWQDRAIAGPVIVTHHGRPRVVIVSAERYAAFTQDGSHGVPEAEQDSRTSLSAVLSHVSDGFISLDRDLRIASANNVAAAYFNLGVERMVGQPFAAVLTPAVQPVLIEQCRRVLRSGESVSFEIDSTDPSERHIQVHAFPYPGGVGLSFTNHTELRALQDYRADLNSIRAALSAHTVISFATLNARGWLSGCNESFSAVSGFPPQDLQGRPFTDFVADAERDMALAALERVLDRREVVKLESSIRTAAGGEQRVCITMAPIIRQVAPEGVSVVLTPLAEAQAAAQPKVRSA